MHKSSCLLVLLMAICSCASLPKNVADKNEQIITVGPGPEDIVIDTISGEPRILLSCNARRKGDPYYGEINAYYINTGAIHLLKREEPAGIRFCPHGIDLVKVKDTLILLVVNHDGFTHENAVLRYAVHNETLVYLNKIVDPLIVSPNAVTGFTDGTVLVSNDAGKHDDYWEALFKQKRCKIIYWNYNKCTVAADKFCFANGITVNNNKVYLVSTIQNKLWAFDFKDGKMINEKTIAAVPGADNIRVADNGDLYVACHLRYFAFIRHMNNVKKHSPTTVYRVNPATGLRTAVYFDDGKKLSAGSTGLAFRNKLYVSGVFDPKMGIIDNP